MQSVLRGETNLEVSGHAARIATAIIPGVDPLAMHVVAVLWHATRPFHILESELLGSVGSTRTQLSL